MLAQQKADTKSNQFINVSAVLFNNNFVKRMLYILLNQIMNLLNLDFAKFLARERVSGLIIQQFQHVT